MEYPKKKSPPKKNPARDPRQCVRGKKIMYCNVDDDVNVVDSVDDDVDGDDDGDDVDDDDDDNHGDSDGDEEEDDDDDDDDDGDDDDEEEDDGGDDDDGDTDHDDGGGDDGDDDDDEGDHDGDDCAGDDGDDDGDVDDIDDDDDDDDDGRWWCGCWGGGWGGGGRGGGKWWCWGGRPIPRPGSTLCASLPVKMYTDISQESSCVEIFREKARRQDRDTGYVRACAVEMHMDVSQDKRPGYHLDWTPALNSYRKNSSVWTHCLGNQHLWQAPKISTETPRWTLSRCPAKCRSQDSQEHPPGDLVAFGHTMVSPKGQKSAWWIIPVTD